MKRFSGIFPLLMFGFLTILSKPVQGQFTNIPRGSFLISMGENPQTINNGLKPYGLLYDVIKNYRVTVYWYINPGKLKDGVDLVHNGKSYRGGVFIIPEFLISPQVRARITAWQSQGVVGAYTIANFGLAETELIKIRSVPRWTMDKQNGIIAVQYLINAGIPPSAYGGSNTANWKDPADLACCDDIFIMPHADPTWATHSNLLYWNLNCKGFLWAACHAPSVLENLLNPANRNEQMNFLLQKDPAFVGTTGDQADDNTLTLYNRHNSGSPPYISRFPTDPVSQYIGKVEGATTNGSEKIYIPRQSAGTSARWNPSARILEYDASQRNVASPDTIGFTNVAAVLVYGRGFEDPNRGYVMYLGGHSHDGTSQENIAAMRSMLNLSFLSSSDKSLAPDISFLPDTLVSGKSVEFDYVLPDEANPNDYTTEWTSSCGGTFLPNRFTKNVTYIPPPVSQSDTCFIGVTVTDLCERVSTEYKFVVLTANPAWTLEKSCVNEPATYTTAGESLNFDLALTNTGDVDITGVVLTDNQAVVGPDYQYGDDGDNILEPGETWIYTALSQVSQADIDAGFFTNIATATGISGGGILPDVSDTVTVIPTWLPSITLTKEVTDGFSYNQPGDQISYSYTIENTGTVSLSGPFTVSDDKIPNVPQAFGTLLPGALVTVNASYIVQESDLLVGNVTNIAVASTIFQGQPLLSNESEATVYVDQADLSITKSVNDAHPNVGDVITYTISVLNEGPNPASSVDVVDVIPYGLDEINQISDGGVYDPSTRTITWSGFTLIRPVAFTYTAVVQPPLEGYSFDNYAEVTASDQFDPDSTPGNQSLDEDDDDTLEIVPRIADVFGYKLQISQPDNLPIPNGGTQVYVEQDSVVAGTNIYYLITIGNLGPDTAREVLITDDFPAEVLNPEYSLDNGGTWTEWTGSFQIPVLPPTPQGIPAVFRGFVPASTPAGTFENSVGAESFITYDPDLVNNDSTVVTRVVSEADLSLNKRELIAPVVIEGPIMYEIVIENHGPSDAVNVQIEDVIDPAVISSTEYSEDLGLTWIPGWPGTYNAGDLLMGEQLTLRIRGTVVNAAPEPNVNPIPNTATVVSDTPDPNLSNNSETVLTPLNNEADLSIEMAYNTPTCAGDTVFYTITVINQSNTINSFGAHVIGVSNPTYFSSISYSTNNGLTWLPWNMMTDQFDITDPFLPLDTFRMVIKARLRRGLPPGSISGTIYVESDFTPDPVNVNNAANWTVQVANCADLTITKTLVTPPQLVIAGRPVEFLLTFTNQGPSDATQTVVLDALPSGITGPVTASTCNTGGSFIPWNGSVNIGTIAPGSSCFVRILGTFDSNFIGDYTNVACVESGSPDPDTLNNKDTLVVKVYNPSILLEKSADKKIQVPAGELVTYTYTVSNTGNANMTNVTMTDVHGGTGILSAITPTSFALLPKGGSVQFTATYVVTQEDVEKGLSIENTATARATYQGFNYTDTDMESIEPEDWMPEFVIEKTATEEFYTYSGDTVRYDIRVENTGNVTISGISVTDADASALPAYRSGDLDSDNKLDLGEIWFFDAYRVMGQADVDAGDFINTAEVSGIPAGGMLSPVQDTALAKAIQNPSLFLQKVITSGRVYRRVGDIVTYSYTITNTGNVTLPGPFAVSDDKILTIEPVSGVLSPGDSLEVTAEYVVTAEDLAAGSVVNTAYATTILNLAEVRSNEDHAIAIVDAADISVDKSVSEVRPDIGNVVTFTISVTNSGPNQATGVSIVDRLPSGYQAVSDIQSGGIYDILEGTVRWNELTLLPNSTLLLQYSVEVVASGEAGAYENYVELDSLDQYDPDSTPGNQSTDEDDDARKIIFPRTADLATTKWQIHPSNLPLANSLSSGASLQEITPSEVVAGEKIYYAIHHENLGPDTSFVVSMQDEIPGGILNPEFSLDYGNSWLPWSGAISVSQFSTLPGELYVLIRGDVDPSFLDTITNTSVIESFETYDPDLTNNISTIKTRVNPVADLMITKIATEAIVDIGGGIDYVLTIQNLGPSNATGVVVSDTLDPSVFSDILYSEDEGITWNSGWTNQLAIGTLPVGASRVIRISATITDQMPSPNQNPVDNTAWVTSSVPDPDLANNVDSVKTDLREQADLYVVKTGPSVLCAGDTAVFTLRLYNLGSTFESKGIVITELFDNQYFSNVAYSDDEGMTWQVWTGPGGQYNVLQPIQPRDSFTLLVRAVIRSSVIPGVVSNRVQVSSALTPDDDLLNNEAEWQIQVNGCADLNIQKTLLTAEDQVLAGEEIEFELTATNHGPSDAYNVVVTDLFPPGLTGPFTYASCNSAVYVPWTGAASIGNLLSGGSCTIRVRATVASDYAGPLTNIGCVMGETDDPDDANNKDTIIVEVLKPSVTLVKTADKMSELALGEVVNYTYTVTNTGNATLKNIQLADIHEGYGALGPIMPVGYDSLFAGNSVIFTASYEVVQEDIDDGRGIQNIATVTAEYKGRNYSSRDTLVVSPEAKVPDIQILKNGVWNDVNLSVYPEPGETIEYTFEVTNTGNVTLREVVVLDTLVTVDCGEFDGILAPGEIIECTASYSITQRDINLGRRDNTAEVSGVDPDDNVVSNSDDAMVDLPQKTQVAFIKKGSQLRLRTDGVATPGDTIIFDYTMTNTGNVTLTDVKVTENDFTGAGNWPLPFFVSADMGSNEATMKVGESHIYRAYYPIAQEDINEGFVNNRGKVDATGPQALLPDGRKNGFSKRSVTTDLSDSSNLNDPNETGIPSDPNGDDPTYTFIPHDGRIGVSKQVVGVTKLANSNFDVTFRIRVGNPGNLILEQILLTDDVENNLGNAFVQYKSMPVVVATQGTPVLPVIGSTPDILYDGTGGLLYPGDMIDIEFVVEIDPDAAGVPMPLLNQAYTTALPTDGLGNVLVNQKKGLPETLYGVGDIEDLSDSGPEVDSTNPDEPGDTGGEDDPTPVIIPSIDVAKSITQIKNPASQIPGNRELTFRFRIQNSGNIDLEDVQLQDPIRNELSGIWVGLTALPVITYSSAIETPVLRTGFDGVTNATMFTGTSGRLRPGEIIEVVMSVEVDPNKDVTYMPVYNQATASGYGVLSDGLRVLVTDLSDDGYKPQGPNPDFPGDTGGPDDPTPVLVPVISTVKYAQSYENAMSGVPGHFDIVCRIGVKNIGNVSLANISMNDTISLLKYFGPYFVGLAPGTMPVIISSTATQVPTLNPGFRGTIAQPEIFSGNGLLKPGEEVIVQMRLEMDATIVPVPDSLWNRATVWAYAARPDGMLYRDSLGNVVNTSDFSDAGFNYETTNPDQPEDQDTEDDETLFQFLAYVGNRVWDDKNGDGLQTAGEPGLPGVTVRLYNQSGLVASKVTDAMGNYLFSDLLPGSYYLQFVPASGFLRTSPNKPGSAINSDVDNSNGLNTTSWMVVSAPGTLDIDAGFYKCIQLGDLVWYDINKNDVWNTNENGINNIVVRLWRNENGSWIVWNTTKTGPKPGSPSDDGFFSFCVPPGQYYVEVVMPPQGLVRVRPNIGNVEEIDSDITNAFGPGTTNSFVLISGQSKTDLGAGFYPMASAGNLVWRDENLNGMQDIGEPRVSGVKVEVLDAETGQKLAEATTKPDGTYKIDYLEKRDVYLRFLPPAGYGATYASMGDDALDSDVDHTFGLYTTRKISMLPGVQNMNIDMGLAYGVLPVEWLDIRVTKSTDRHILTWVTGRESNVSHYIVERRLENETSFSDISGPIPGRGNRQSGTMYVFEDEDLLKSGVYIYRVRQVDLDNSFGHSRMVSTQKEQDDSVFIYPNPARSTATIEVRLADDSDLEIEILDPNGQKIVEVAPGAIRHSGLHVFELDLQAIPAGVYSVKVTINELVSVYKFVRID